MQKLKIQFLISSSFLFFFISCKTFEIPNVTKIENKQKSYKNTYFSNPETDYIYKATIDVYSKQLSGIFVAKKINDSRHRVVFTTDFGNTLMDVEVSENYFKVNYCIEELNRKIILNTLKNDFRLLFKPDHTVVEAYENELDIIYKTIHGKRFNYLLVSKKEIQLKQLIHTSKTKEKVVINFQSKNSTLAENIVIEHQNIQLLIELNLLNN